MKIKTATIGRGKVVNTGNYESQRFYVELEAELTDYKKEYDELAKLVEIELERLVKKDYIANMQKKVNTDSNFRPEEFVDEKI